MSATEGTIIVGGGIVGVTTLYELVRRGLPAILLEKSSRIARSTSYANAGMLTPSMSDPWNSPGVGQHLMRSMVGQRSPLRIRPHVIPGLVGWGSKFLLNSSRNRHSAATARNYRLAAHSVSRTKELIHSLRIDCDMSDNGSLKIFDSEQALNRSLAVSRQLTELGLRFEILDRRSLLEREPEFRAAQRRLEYGIYYPDDIVADSHLFALELAKHCKKAGGKIHYDTCAEEVLTNGDRVVGVRTNRGILDAATIVVAAGTASPKIAKTLGCPLAIKPVKGYSATIDASEWPAMPNIGVVDDATHAAIVPIGRRVRVSGIAELAGDDLSIDKNKINGLCRNFLRLYPALSPYFRQSNILPWTGLRPTSADGSPFIGRAGLSGLWINTGHGHLGWTMALGSSDILVRQMCGEHMPFDPVPYDPGR